MTLLIEDSRSFDAKPAFLEEMLDYIEGISSGLDNKAAFNLRLACEEILVNITDYAYPEDDGTLTLFWQQDTQERLITIVFTDAGTPFNPLLAEAPNLDVPLAERKIGGLGILMVQKLMDDVKYEYADGENRLTVTMRY